MNKENLNRRERRAKAKESGEKFSPKYNGREPKTHKEMFGVGYERFNNKFITIKEEDLKPSES